LSDDELLTLKDALGNCTIPISDFFKGKETMLTLKLEDIESGYIELVLTAFNFGKEEDKQSGVTKPESNKTDTPTKNQQSNNISPVNEQPPKQPSEIEAISEEISIAPKPVDGVYNSRYKIIGRIGKGNFGTVVKVRDLQESKDKAMKIVPCVSLNQSSQAYREATTTKQIKHDNLVEYLDLFISTTSTATPTTPTDSNAQRFVICLIMPPP